MNSRSASLAQRITAGLTGIALCVGQLAIPPSAEASHLGSSTASAGSAPPPSVSAIQSFQLDLFTGRATTAIPIAVPPGRKGMQPGLALGYSSSGRNSWVGTGWVLDLGYIERSTKNGPPRYDSTDTYTFMFQGVASDLVKIPDGTYRAKDEGLFMRFENKGASGWEVRDKSGTRYLFGGNPDSEQTAAGGTFRWCLRKVLDTNGNFLTVTYVKDQGQSYLSRIDYTGHETSGVQDVAPANYVTFITEARPDVEVSYRSGAEAKTALRLKEIAAYAQNQLARKYVLTYAQSQRSGRSLLASVTQVGADGVTSMPAMTFTYQDAPPTYTLSSNTGAAGQAAWNLRKANVDTGHENFGCVSPYVGLPWGSPVIVSSTADLGCMNATVNSDGSITVNGCNDHFMHAWTWVYSASPNAITLSYNGSEACLFREDSTGIQNFGNGGSVPLAAGWSLLHLTGYHQHSGWTNTMSSPLKNLVTVMNPTQFLKPQLAGDVDGNGLTDLITFDAVAGSWSVSLSRGTSFSPSTIWLPSFGGTSSTPLLGDWNADGRTDLATYNSGSWAFATSTAAGFQTGTVSPLSFGSGMPLTGDFNGDGIIDIGTYNNGSWQVALGTGSGFSPASSFSRSLGSSSATPLTGDFNGDGYTDIAVVESGTVTVATSSGSSFPQAATWLPGFGSANYTSADFNGDGLTDVAYYDKTTGQVRYAPSTGGQFGPPVIVPVTFSLRSTDDNIQVGDFNGDGLADPAVFNAVTGSMAELTTSQGSQPDLLTQVVNGLGGTTTLTYQPSTTFDNTGEEDALSDLPFVIPVVTRVDLADGMGRTYTTLYTYEGGRFDAPTKEFRGFRHVDATDDADLVTHHRFLQAADTKGRLETQFTTDSQQTGRFHEVDNEYLTTAPYPGVTFTSLNHQAVREYNGNSTFKETHAWFWFDQYGNVTRTDEQGDVAMSGDERAAVTSYATNETVWILNKPRLVQTLDATGTVVAQHRFSYDGAADSTLAPTKGNLTQEEEWLNVPTAQWLATTLTYDVYGNVKTVNDALNRTTTNTYDATGTYLTQIANALGHTRQLAYDARFGQVTSSTDQNGAPTTTEYDALGRVTKVIGPTDTASLPTVSYEYALSPMPPSKMVVHTRIQSGQSGVLTVYTFTDGLGRTIQTRGPAEDPAKQVVGGAVEFDTRGLVVKQWVPYLDAVSSSYVPHTMVAGLAPPVTYTYDITGRLLTTTDPDGSIASTAYDDWSVAVTDANGHQTRRTSDASGRLLTIEEFNGGQTYTTSYQYDVLDNLLQVTDAAGHVTRITYDSLGRKIAMDDPDMGHWTYAYDAVDNLTSQTDARGVVINFTYDTLNRLTQKSYTTPAGSGIPNPGAVTYRYDEVSANNLYAKGKLTSITDGSGASSFTYDKLGRLTKESKTIDGTTYTTQRAYDLLGRLTRLTYPDGEYADYTYNAQGGIETATLRKVVGDSGTQVTPVVTDISYNAAGQILKIAYGNGVVTDYSYNPQTLRLDRLLTNGPAGTLQDYAYEFDPSGNVKAIRGSVASVGGGTRDATQLFGYDGLSRLTAAQGPYGAFTYTYDPIGNMTEKEGVTMTYGEGPAGPHAVTSTSAGLTMAYDANGNMVKKSPTALGLEPTAQLFSFDAENRLVKVDTAQEETVSVTFQPGWNFFSLPVLPDDGAVVVLLPNFAADFEQIAKFDAATNGFKHYVGNPKFNDFNELEYGVGYQVYCKAAAPITVNFTGKVPTQRASQPLAAGWNLLGSSLLADTAVATWLAGVPYTDVRDLNPVDNSLPVATQAKPGKAYWVRLSAAATWTPPLPKNVTTSYVYDGDGGKVKQITAAGTTTYLGEVYEKGPSGKTTKYVFAGSLRIANKSSDGELLFYHTDHLGSSDVVTNTNGQMVEHTEHLPYGAISRHDGPKDLPHKFTGQRQDTTNGLILFPGRAYDPDLGRFLQPDPFVQDPSDPQSLNRYAYVRNNPINFVDPSGYLFGWDDLLYWIIAAAVTAGVTYATWPFKEGFDPSILQDTGERFWSSLIPPIIQSSQQLSQAAVTIASGAKDLANTAVELEKAAVNNLINFGHSATAAAVQVAQATPAAVQAMSDAISDATESYLPPLVKNLRETAAKKAIEKLSEVTRITTKTTVLIAQTVRTTVVGVFKEVGTSQPLRFLKKSGTLLSGALTVSEVVRTYQDPVLTPEQKDKRAGIQGGAFGIGLVASFGVAAGVAALAATFPISGPVTFGLTLIGSASAGTVIDIGKDWLLKRLGLQ